MVCFVLFPPICGFKVVSFLFMHSQPPPPKYLPPHLSGSPPAPPSLPPRVGQVGGLHQSSSGTVVAKVSNKEEGKAKNSFTSGEDVFVIPGLQDRKFTADEARMAFDAIDIDRNGTLDASDIHKMLAVSGLLCDYNFAVPTS